MFSSFLRPTRPRPLPLFFRLAHCAAKPPSTMGVFPQYFVGLLIAVAIIETLSGTLKSKFYLFNSFRQRQTAEDQALPSSSPCTMKFRPSSSSPLDISPCLNKHFDLHPHPSISSFHEVLRPTYSPSLRPQYQMSENCLGDFVLVHCEYL